MPLEQVTIRNPGGASFLIDAEVSRHSASNRKLRAGLLIGGGLIGGGACIIVPILHLITTWALPLIGVVAGLLALKTFAKVAPLSTHCPGCEAALELPGGSVGATLTLGAHCLKCQTPVEVALRREMPEDKPGSASPMG